MRFAWSRVGAAAKNLGMLNRVPSIEAIINLRLAISVLPDLLPAGTTGNLNVGFPYKEGVMVASINLFCSG